MHEDQATWRRLHGLEELAVHQLECGRVTREVEEIVGACAAGMELPRTTMINLGRSVTVQHVADDGRTLSSSSAVAVSAGVNCEQARQLDEASLAIAEGQVPDTQIDEVLEEASMGRQPWYAGVLGLSLLTASIALQFGVGVTGSLFTAALEFVVATCGVLLKSGRLPLLFVAMAQALLGGGLALAGAAADIVSWEAAVAAVAVSWLVLVPQPAVVASAADAVDGEYPAAIARGAVVVLTLIGIAVGVGSFVKAVDAVAPAHLGASELPSLAWPLVIIFSGVGALANAFANGGGRRLVAPAAAIGMGTGALNLLLGTVLGIEAVISKSLVAAVLGLCAAFLAHRIGYPAAVLALMGITGACCPETWSMRAS